MKAGLYDLNSEFDVNQTGALDDAKQRDYPDRRAGYAAVDRFVGVIAEPSPQTQKAVQRTAFKRLERETRLELATSTLARLRSTN